MCMMTSSKPSAPKTAPAPAYVAPIAQAAPPPPPPPPPPVPAAPIPFYDQANQEAVSNEKTNNNVSRAKVGRAALKINLVNSGGDESGSTLNTTN
jgi:hypothetical protein